MKLRTNSQTLPVFSVLQILYSSLFPTALQLVQVLQFSPPLLPFFPKPPKASTNPPKFLNSLPPFTLLSPNPKASTNPKFLNSLPPF